MSGEAELRASGGDERPASAGPDGPDEMGRELAGGPAAVDAALEAVSAAGDRLGAALAAAERIVLVGTGMSLAVSMAAAPALRRSRRAAGMAGGVAVREATAVALGGLDGEAWLARDLVVAISKSGASPETLAAARDAAAAGCRVLALTADAGSPLAAGAALTIATPMDEEHGAGTRSALAALAALLALGEVEGEPLAAGSMLPGQAEARAASEWLRDAVADWAAPAGLGVRLADARRIWIVGLGSGVGLAYGASILWHEKVHRPAVAVSVSEFRHGPIESAASGDAVVIVDPDEPDAIRKRYLDHLRSELGQLRVFTVLLGATSGAPAAPPGELSEDPVGEIAIPLRAGGSTRILEALVRLQQLARATALEAGTYRDGFAILRNVVAPATELVEPR